MFFGTKNYKSDHANDCIYMSNMTVIQQEEEHHVTIFKGLKAWFDKDLHASQELVHWVNYGGIVTENLNEAEYFFSKQSKDVRVNLTVNLIDCRWIEQSIQHGRPLYSEIREYITAEENIDPQNVVLEKRLTEAEQSPSRKKKLPVDGETIEAISNQVIDDSKSTIEEINVAFVLPDEYKDAKIINHLPPVSMENKMRKFTPNTQGYIVQLRS